MQGKLESYGVFGFSDAKRVTDYHGKAWGIQAGAKAGLGGDINISVSEETSDGRKVIEVSGGFGGGVAVKVAATKSKTIVATTQKAGTSTASATGNNTVHTTNLDGTHKHTIIGGDNETRPKNAYVNYIIKY